MRSLLTFLTCASFAFFAVGCYSLQPENIAGTHTVVIDDDMQLKMKNGTLHKWAEGQVDSVRVDTAGVVMFKGGVMNGQSPYPIDSVKTLYVTKYNPFRTTVASVFVLTLVAPLLLLIAFPLRLG